MGYWLGSAIDMHALLSKMPKYCKGCQLGNVVDTPTLPQQNAQVLQGALDGQYGQHAYVSQSISRRQHSFTQLKFLKFLIFFFWKICANVVLIYILDMLNEKICPQSLKIPIKNYFLDCLMNLTRFNFVTVHIQTKLTNTQIELFKKSIFGHFLAIGGPRFSDNLVHYLLIKPVMTTS